MSRRNRGHAVRAALASGLLVAGALNASACGGASDTDAPRRTATPVTRGESTAPPAPAAPALRPGPPLTPQTVVERLAGRRIDAGGRTVRVDAGTVACGGLGQSSQPRRAKPTWTRFRCIQPTFPPGAVAGPDLIFVVRSVAPHELVVTERHFTSY